VIGSNPAPALLKLEPAGSADLDALMMVMQAAFDARFGEAWTRSQCRGILPMTGVSLMLAWDEKREQPLGFSLFRTVAGDAELLLLAVSPTSRRRGVGRRLLEHFVERAISDGATRVHLEVRDGNPAIEMYRSAGFEAAGRRRNYYRGTDGSQFDALTFVLTT
jgi:ribosomal-protein-alanine N-acetyltransferase